MKKFSFILAGVFLLWTMAFVLADESKWANALTGSILEEPTITTVDSLIATEVATWDTTEVTTWDTTEVITWDTTIGDSAKWKYNEEQIAAYEWALEKGITTIDNIDKARLSDWLTRAELAKMMSQYMTKVLWKTPAETEDKVNYADVDQSLGDLADFIQTAYAYKIMWINADGTPLKNFNPNGKVTRAEYATVFSRVLFGDKYNKSEWDYYEDHLKALNEAGILTNTTPSITEVRGWVMLMMYRSTNVENNDSEPTIWMPNPASVYCEEQGGTVNIVKNEEGNESGMCKLADGTEIDEWEYYRANNTGAVESLYSEEDLTVAEATIKNYFENEMTVKVENIEISYLWDEKATSELSYCKEFEEREGLTVDECAVFSSDFYIPEQDAEMAWAFEPNKTITWYQCYLWRTKWWEWKVLTMGF